MTLEEVRAMTPEEKRVKLAELLGWRRRRWRDRQNRACEGWDSPTERLVALPDYCNDLNAVHEVERSVLVEEERDRTGTYEDHLSIICDKRDNRDTERELCYPMFATADQRTTALILTLSTQR